MKKVLSALLSLVILVSLSINGFAAEYQRTKITAEKSTIYETASTTAVVLATANKDYSFVPVTGSTKSFWKLDFKKKNDDTVYTGYILKVDTDNSGVVAEAAGSTTSKAVSKADESSNSSEAVSEGDKFIVFWGNTGDKVHISPECRTITNGVLNGTLEECKAAGHTAGWCGVCSKGWTDEKFLKDGNPNVR